MGNIGKACLLSLSLFSCLFLPGCSSESTPKGWEKFFWPINAFDSGSIPSALQLPKSGRSSKTDIIAGVPSLSNEGFCGDGIINGENEHCDREAQVIRSCSQIGGLGGTVTCGADCDLDISNCITPAVDQKLGGISEECECQCGRNKCEGDCMPLMGLSGQSECDFRCSDDCVCSCKGKLETHIEECNFRGMCSVVNGSSRCEFRMDYCRTLAIIGPGIGSKIIRE